MSQFPNSKFDFAQKPNYVRVYAVEWVLLVAALVVFGLFVFFTLMAEYRATTEREKNQLTTQVKIVQGALTTQLASIRNAQINIRNEIVDGLVHQDERGIFVRKRLQGFAESIPSVWLMMVLDKSGTAIEACDSWLLGRNFSEHEYFKRAQKNPDLERLYISAPFKNEVNTLTIAATTMLPDLEGRFNGAIVTILDPKTTVELLKSVLYAQDARASVAYGEGALFLLAPEYKEGLVVESGLLQPAYAQHLKASELLTLQQVRGVPQNEHRMLALHTVNPAELHMDAGCWLASVGMCRCSTVIITAMHI